MPTLVTGVTTSGTLAPRAGGVKARRCAVARSRPEARAIVGTADDPWARAGPRPRRQGGAMVRATSDVDHLKSPQLTSGAETATAALPAPAAPHGRRRS